jgi:cell division septation protein DedD
MLPPVVVDLGPDVARPQVSIVLDACNEAIARGVCVPEGSAGAEAPRALAVARATDRRVRVVRIEVRLSGAGADGVSFVRELRFARRDPISERWRTVGLAIATLVGEGEQRAREDDTAVGAPSAAVPAPAASEPEPPTPAAPEPAAAEPSSQPSSRDTAEREPEPEPPAPVQRDTRPRREPEIVFEPEEPGPPLDFSHRPLFVGLGALVGSGFDAGWRGGGRLRGGYHFESGLVLLASASYALGSQEEPAVAWLSLDAGVGYRLALSERLNVGAGLFAGAERARYELSAEVAPSETPAGALAPVAAPRSETSLSPRFGLTADVWWRAVPMFGLWAALDGSTSGRETRVFISPDREPARAFPLAVALSVGFGFWLD